MVGEARKAQCNSSALFWLLGGGVIDARSGRAGV